MGRKDRTILSEARELVKIARKLFRIHHDVLEPRHAAEVKAATERVESAIADKHVAKVTSDGAKLEELLNKFFPRPKYAGLRENVEVLLVAIIVAMAVRTFFIQPFKIPTGSMQPTLYGIHEDPKCNSAVSLPQRVLELVAFGKSYNQNRCTRRGDHIFVDKLSYHFRQPRRGEVIVFETNDIPDIPAASRGKFYIKRLIATAGDVVQIRPPHVLVNGEILDSRAAFERIYSKKDGYSGYVNVIPEGQPPRFLRRPEDTYRVPGKHLFVLGDNSEHSADGRFWGSVPEKDLVGRAVVVYWPFSRRFGLID